MFHIVIGVKVLLYLYCHAYLSEGHPFAPVHCSLMWLFFKHLLQILDQ